MLLICYICQPEWVGWGLVGKRPVFSSGEAGQSDYSCEQSRPALIHTSDSNGRLTVGAVFILAGINSSKQNLFRCMTKIEDIKTWA